MKPFPIFFCDNTQHSKCNIVQPADFRYTLLNFQFYGFRIEPSFKWRFKFSLERRNGGRKMVCPKCGNSNVNVQIVTDTQLKNKHHGIFWWLLIGWWWIPVKWFFFTIPALIFKIFVPKRKKVVNTHRKMCICQNCGHSWEAK